ncbi:alpha/beta hydrolase [Halarchaeum sp. CBA1220]|uniref:alpha/beta hydrolase n=1 Tax=Halarchaeum sp. CBA1220 TaxID=1853682 RepID=UPI000F3A9B3D|nr:alpha/beta hydrolase [Halarchaeum sp. CBA1220]QLC32980.1 alpha/beta hydrolase [Halarchaeum sp. CBA1220]
MRRETVLVPGARRVEATLDAPDDADGGGAGDRVHACVVACPPHPEGGGSRSDRRLTAVSDSLTERGVACLRLDYGAWDGGDGEREDARNALRWASERYASVGLFGYSFGAGIAALAAADVGVAVGALALLAPDDAVGDGLHAARAVRGLDASLPVHVVYGERDERADWRPVVDAVRERGGAVDAFDADHTFLGRRATTAADAIAAFLARELRA